MSNIIKISNELLLCSECKFKPITIPNRYDKIENMKNLLQLEFISCKVHEFDFKRYEFSSLFVCLKEFERNILELPKTQSHGIFRQIQRIAKIMTGNRKNIGENRIDNDIHYSDLVYEGSSIDIRYLMMKIKKCNLYDRSSRLRLFESIVNCQTMINVTLLEHYLLHRRNQLSRHLGKILPAVELTEDEKWSEEHIQLLAQYDTINSIKAVSTINQWYMILYYKIKSHCLEVDTTTTTISETVYHIPQVKRKHSTIESTEKQTN